MLYAGLDLSRKKVDVHVLDEAGKTVAVTAVAPEGWALQDLVRRFAGTGEEVTAVIESMNGARFVHDTLELAGWDVLIADAARARALAPLAAKTDRIDAWVLAELGRRDLVPAIWLPDIATRSAREVCRFRQHLVGHRTALKNRIHATLIAHGHPVAMRDLFGKAGRAYLAELAVPEPWNTTLAQSLELIGETEERIKACERDLLARALHDPYVPLLVTVPGIGLILGSIIAAELGDIGRFASAKKFVGYTGLCPFVRQSGGRDDGARSPRTVRACSAGRSSRSPPTPACTRCTGTTTSAQGSASASVVALRSPGSSSPAPSPPRSGTCSARTSPSPRQVPFVLWSLDDPS